MHATRTDELPRRTSPWSESFAGANGNLSCKQQSVDPERLWPDEIVSENLTLSDAASNV
jgi:hypothetical protein